MLDQVQVEVKLWLSLVQVLLKPGLSEVRPRLIEAQVMLRLSQSSSSHVQVKFV